VSDFFEIRDLSCTLGKRSVLRQLSFSVQAGQKLALLGANGSGKSTLIHTLLGFLPYEGSARVGTMELRDHVSEIRRTMGAMLACIDDQLLLPTVSEEIRFSLESKQLPEAAREACVRQELARLHILPIADRRSYELSSGEKQKVVLASLLAPQPTALILDEPTKEIDVRTRNVLIHHLKQLPQTMIIATHDYDFAVSVCNSALVLHDGRGLYFSSLSFLKDHGLMASMQLL
jgi:cobalt/nickel transport system ATP-binding protein